MNNLKLDDSRYDFFLIWGHGIKYKKRIIELINSEENFDIKMIVHHNIKNINKFVKKVYQYDYVPYFHLRGKTRYLMTTPKEVLFVFIKNNNPREVWRLGCGTGHIESESIVELKNTIRNNFNERKEDKRTENHVVHASDNEMQVNDIIKYLGYKEGIKLFDRHKNKPVKIPYFIGEFDSYQIKEIDINDIRCNILEDFKHKMVGIEDSPQYKFLLGKEKEYQEYVDKYSGGFLRAYYDLTKYKEISLNFSYLSNGYETEYIVVKKVQNIYLVIDGLHRVSIVKNQGHQKLIVMEIT